MKTVHNPGRSLLLTLLFLCLLPAQSLSQGIKPHDNDAKLRRQKLIQFQAAREPVTLGFYGITARLALNIDIERCRRDFRKRLESPVGDMFFSMPMMGAYLHGKKHWTEKEHQKARETWQTYLPYRGDTENHWIMWHTALLLAAQEFPDMTADEWVNGRSTKENYDDALGWLNFWFETTTTIGQGEFDSPDYLAEYLGALCLLYDFADDKQLRKKAEMALHWLLADYAIDYLEGQYTGGHSRIYEPRLLNSHREVGLPFGYVFFGGTPFPDKASMAFSIFAAVTSYQMPDIIRRIATDRSTPFYAKERKRVRNRIRFAETMNPPVYKHNYMSTNFSLGSIDGGLQQPIQIHTWDVSYTLGPGKGDVFFALHPYYSDYELGMFFPEELKVMITEVVKSKGTYDKEDKWTGASPYERVFQHQNTLIALYELDPSTHYKHIDYYFSNTLSELEEHSSGWKFLQAGKAWIAAYPLQPGEWRTEKSHRRYRSPHLQNGYVVEAWESSEFSSWQAFKEKFSASKPEFLVAQGKTGVRYQTSNGDKMAFTFPEDRRLNGKEVNLSTMPLFDGPLMQGNNRVLRLQHGGEYLEIDFNKLETRGGLTK